MSIPDSWLNPSCLEEAIVVQRLLAKRVQHQDEFGSLHLMGGMDVSNNLYDPNKMVYAACITLDSEKLLLQAQKTSAQHQIFPFISGFLGFREAPSLIDAFNQLTSKPDIIMVDGHGISHPRQLGIASHIGVLLDIPTIGVAKTILVGKPKGIVGPAIGDRTPLIWKDKEIGMLLRTKLRCNPLIISTGHRVSLESAIEIVLNNLTKYRLPEATRHAHLISNDCRRQNSTLKNKAILQPNS